MAISPLGSVIYTNQSVTAAATKQTAVQNRNEMQSVMASAIANEKEEVVKEVRPTEETYKIDPEKEHQKQKNEEESGAKEEETTKDTKHKHLKQNEEDTPTSILDITV